MNAKFPRVNPNKIVKYVILIKQLKVNININRKAIKKKIPFFKLLIKINGVCTTEDISS